MQTINWMKLPVMAAAVAGFTLTVMAQEPKPSEDPADPAPQSGMMGKTGMMGMMKKCMEHCRTVRESSSGEALERLRQAKASEDPAVLRAALDEALKALEDGNKRMEACMKMMGGMEMDQSGEQ